MTSAILRVVVAVAVLAATPAAGAAPEIPDPRRVISTSLCADQFALALLEPERIVAVSEQAADPELSVFWEKAVPLPKTRGSAEEIMLSGADIVISNAWGVSKTRDFLESQGVQVVALPLLEDLDEIAALTVEVARVLGVEQRGRALVDDYSRRLARIRETRTVHPMRGIYLSPGGTTAGAGTFGHQVITEGGVRNIAADELGKSGWGSVGLEQVVTAAPDLLVLSFFRDQSLSTTQRIRYHSAFQAMTEKLPAATVPGETWICSAWFLIQAIEAIAGDVDRIEGIGR